MGDGPDCPLVRRPVRLVVEDGEDRLEVQAADDDDADDRMAVAFSGDLPDMSFSRTWIMKR